MFVLIIVIHYYTYMALMITANFIIKNNGQCCAYSLYTSQILSYNLDGRKVSHFLITIQKIL